METLQEQKTTSDSTLDRIWISGSGERESVLVVARDPRPGVLTEALVFEEFLH